MNLSKLLLALFLICGSLPAYAQGPGKPPPPQKDREHRWEKMEGQRKRDLRKRYDQLHRMDADKRKTKLDRAKRLREIMAEVYSRMDAETKKRVDAMSPSEKSNLLGRLALEEARSRSREARLVLGPKEKPGAEGEARNGPDRKARKAVHEEFLRKARERLRAYVQKNGLPKGVTQEEWEAFQKLEGHKFGRKLRKWTEKHREWVQVIGPPPGKESISQEHWDLHQALRIPQREHMRMIGPRRKPGSKEEMTRRRKRVMSVLKKQGLTEEELNKVKALNDRGFMEWVRQRIGPRKRPGGERNRGPKPRPGRGPEGRPDPGHQPPPGRGGRPPHGAQDRPGPRGPGLSPHPGRPRPRKDSRGEPRKDSRKDSSKRPPSAD